LLVPQLVATEVGSQHLKSATDRGVRIWEGCYTLGYCAGTFVGGVIYGDFAPRIPHHELPRLQALGICTHIALSHGNPTDFGPWGPQRMENCALLQLILCTASLIMTAIVVRAQAVRPLLTDSETTDDDESKESPDLCKVDTFVQPPRPLEQSIPINRVVRVGSMTHTIIQEDDDVGGVCMDTPPVVDPGGYRAAWTADTDMSIVVPLAADTITDTVITKTGPEGKGQSKTAIPRQDAKAVLSWTKNVGRTISIAVALINFG
jgi:hypothetical protein